MRAAATWENEEYRCQLCMQLYAADVGHAHTPLVVCQNVHTVCAQCYGELQARQPPKCPQCRADLWADAKANRDFISVLSRLELQCGGCDSDVRMSNAEALRHASECSNNHLRCPMPSGLNICADGLHECRQDVTVAKLWEHCQMYHNAADNKQVHMLAAAPLSSALSTVLTVDLDLSASRTVFFIVQTPAEAYRFCLHLVVTPDGRVFGALRRFFPEAALVFDKILLALEAGELCGLVTQLRAPLLCYERLAELVDARADPERTRAAVCELGLPLLRQMAGVGARDGTGVPVSVNMQMWFSERGGAPAPAPVAECSKEAEAEALRAGWSKEAEDEFMRED